MEEGGRGRGEVKSLSYVLGGDRTEKCVIARGEGEGGERGCVQNLRFWRYVISGR